MKFHMQQEPQLVAFGRVKAVLVTVIAASALIYLTATVPFMHKVAEYPRILNAIRAVFPNVQDPSVWHVPDPNRIRLVGTSCAYQSKKYQPMYQLMTEAKPEHILLMGDNVYLDISPNLICKGMELIANKGSDSLGCFNTMYSQETFFQHPATIKAQYDLLLNRPDFLTNLNTNAKYGVWTMWDDHDYGKDNLAASNPYKNMTRVGFVDFWNNVNKKYGDSAVQDVIDMLKATDGTGRGVFYTSILSKTLGDGSKLNIRLYSIDVRWYRDTQSTLGPVQKEWLKTLINEKSSGIDYHVFVTGLTLFTDLKINGLAQLAGKESWYPADVTFLTDLLKQNGLIKKSLILNGDVHYSTVNARDGLFEIVASSLTHSLAKTGGHGVIHLLSGASTKVDFIVTSNSFAVVDIGKTGWQLKFINELGQVISSSDYTMDSQDFTTSLLQKGNVVRSCWWPFCGFPQAEEHEDGAKL